MTGVSLGSDFSTGAPVFLSDQASFLQSLIVGRTGSGKTNLMYLMLKFVLARGDAACIIDPFGALGKNVNEFVPEARLGDVVLLDLEDTQYPFSLPLFGGSINSAVEVFKKVWRTESKHAENHLRALSQIAHDNGGLTLLEANRLFGESEEDREFRERMLANTHPLYGMSARQAFAEAFLPNGKLRSGEGQSVKARLTEITSQPVLLRIFGQKTPTIDLAEIVRDPQPKILIVRLPQTGGEMNKITSQFVGTVIMQHLKYALMEYNHVSWWIFADEFHFVMSGDVRDLITGGRQYGVRLVLATQDFGQIRDPDLRDSVLGVNTRSRRRRLAPSPRG
jgi:hypothetical protein